MFASTHVRSVLAFFLVSMFALSAAWSLPLTPELAAADDEAAKHSNAYREGRKALDESRWSDAARSFNKAIEGGGSDVDAAYYWSAYAYNKAGSNDEALKRLHAFRGDLKKSRWSDDARALESEIRAASGGRVEVAAGADDEIKLLALSSLMHKDSDRALDLLIKFIDGDATPELQKKALFVLSMSESPRAEEIFLDVARGHRGANLQLAAVRHLSFGRDDGGELLTELYGSSSDPELKKTVLQGFGQNGMADELLKAYRSESDPELRATAVRALGMGGATAELRSLYGEEQEVEVRGRILEALSMAGEVDFVIEIARTEKDPELTRKAVRALGFHGSEETQKALRDLYAQTSESELKESLLDAFMSSDDTAFLIQIVRDESDPELRNRALRNLGMNGGDEVWAVFDDIYKTADLETKKVILRSYGVHDQVEKIIAIAKSEADPEVRKAAVQALTFTDSEKATDFLVSLLEND
jgi:HEAT repeat protein